MEQTIKNSAKRILNSFCKLKARQLGSRVIYYHSVSDYDPGCHGIEQFREQMRWISDSGFQVASLKELTDRSKYQRQPCVWITFDDGYSNNLDGVAPILADLNLTATLFVATGFVGFSDRVFPNGKNHLYPSHSMVSQDDLRKWVEYGLEVGSHTVSHRMLSRLTTPEVKRELSESKRFLEDILGRRVEAISFPNGQRGSFTSEVVDLCYECGYRFIFTTLWGGVDQRGVNRTISRCEMAADDSMSEFVDKLSGRRDYRSVVDRVMDKSKVWTRGDEQVAFDH